LGALQNPASPSTGALKKQLFIDINHGFSRYEKSFKQLKTAPVSW
jgi:hypothetical protein